MDEEVADILETLVSVAHGEGRPIVIIERGKPNELALRLFERSTLEYLQKDTRISFSEISMDGRDGIATRSHPVVPPRHLQGAVGH